MLNPWQTVFLVLRAHTPPDVRSSRSHSQASLKQVAHSLRPFCEHLVKMPVRLQHHINHGRNVIVRDFLVKQVAHGIHEHPARTDVP